MLLPLPRYLAAARDIESLPVGEGTIINTGPLALRKVNSRGTDTCTQSVLGCLQCCMVLRVACNQPCLLWLQDYNCAAPAMTLPWKVLRSLAVDAV